MDKYNTRATIENTSFWETFYVINKEGKKRPSIRFWRWCTIIGLHLLFFLSYHIDLQILEGTLSGSRLFGFHMTDPFIAFQMFTAYHSIPTNLIIGTVTVIVVYLLIGGRAYCSWICPYGLISEIGEKLHRSLVKKKIIKSHPFNPKVRYIFWVLFLGLSFVAGYLVFEIINPVGIISRSIIYGWGVALAFVVAIFLVEVFYSQRAWCRYVCPVGTTFSFIGWPSATKIKWDGDLCDHCQVCNQVCIVPHVLEITKKNAELHGKSQVSIISGDCTLCGRCVEVCHTDALSFETKLKKLI